MMELTPGVGILQDVGFYFRYLRKRADHTTGAITRQ